MKITIVERSFAFWWRIRPFHTLNGLFLLFLTFGATKVSAQIVPYASDNIDGVEIRPYYFKDTLGTFGISEMASGMLNATLIRAKSPYLTFGDATVPWWQTFQVYHNANKRKTFILWFSRRNVDSIQVWQKFPNDSLTFLGTFGVSAHDSDRFLLTNGYYSALTLHPGLNQLYIRASNKTGTAYMGYQVLSSERFKIQSRYHVIYFGLFVGVAFISLIFCFLMFSTYSDKSYLFYGLYVIAILLRESFNHAAWFTLNASMQRHCVSLFLGGSFGLFLRYFLRLWDYNKAFDSFVKYYCLSFYILIPFFAFTVDDEQQLTSKILLQLILAALLFNNVLILAYTINWYNRSIQAKVVFWAYLPLFAFSFLNVMRNMNLIPNYGILQHGMMLGFLFEIAIFTIAFVRFYRKSKSSQNDLINQIEIGEKSRALAVKKAENRVKEEIARDLHDDIAASVSSIRILSKIAKEQSLKDNKNISSLFEQINQNAQSTLDNISDLIWTLRPHEDPFINLADRMRAYAMTMLENEEVEYELNMPKEIPDVEIELNTRRNLLVVYKEAMNNAIKHSACSKIKIDFRFQVGRAIMSIQDNGKGFDQQAQQNGIGQGLKKMQDRAKDIGATLAIRSAPGKGTTVEILL
jgi:signal transduction histidine kinase